MTLFIAYLLNIIDYLFSAHWVNLYGVSIEGNPWGRWLLQNKAAFGFKFFFVGAFLAVMGACIRINPKLAPLGYIPLAVYGLVVVYHLGIYIYLKFKM